MKSNYLTFAIFFVLITAISAQEKQIEKFKPHHTLGFLISHTQINQGIQADGDEKWLSLPSWAINYNYKFSQK